MWVPYVDSSPLRCPDGITAPAANAVFGANKQIQCTAGQAYDSDYLTHGFPPPDVYADTFNHSDAYTWTSSIGGSFQSSGNGSTVTWTTPNGYGTATLTCTIKNDADDMMGGTNTRTDWDKFPLVKTRSVYVVNCYANTDSNNNGTIDTATDDPIEETAPGKYVALNDDDDNANEHPDNSSYDDTTVAGENDLVQVNIGYNAGSANINGYKLCITASSGIHVWTSSTKGTQITSGSDYTIGTDTIPGQIYVEGITTGQSTLTVTLKNGATEVTSDTVLFTVETMVHEVTYLDPSGSVGGLVPVRAQVRTRYSALSQLILKERENNVDPVHVTDWTVQGNYTFVSSTTTDRITTSIYKWNFNSVGDISDGKVGLHNATHDLKVEASFTGNITDDDTCSLTTNNLVITSCNPESVVCWKGQQGTTIPITVNLTDNDLNDAVTLTVNIYATNVNNNGQDWPIIRTIHSQPITGSQYTFTWDGKNNNDQYVEPWAYTFEVIATQTDVNNVYPTLTVSDSASFRSKYLSVVRATDEYGQGVFDAQFDGYDDNGTPGDESDDKYMYFIRQYILKDTLDTNAHSGKIILVNPEMNIVDWECDISTLQCLNHNQPDGRNASSTGITHTLRVKIPIDKMLNDGTYLFVLDTTDEHSILYRNHLNRISLCLNEKAGLPKIDLDIDSDNDGNVSGSATLVDENEEDTMEKSSPGCLVALNDDDDNENGKPDNASNESAAVGNEDDLQLIKLKWSPSAEILHLIMELDCNNRNGIRVWRDQIRSQQVTLPAQFPLGDPQNVAPRELYVEGYEANAATLGMTMKLMLKKTTAGEAIQTDKVVLTSVNAVVESPTVDTRVLINMRSDVIQDGNTFPSQYQTEARKIAISIHTIPLIENMKVYFKSNDIDDESPYEVDTNGEDNNDQNNKYGAFEIPTGQNGDYAFTDSLGKANVVFKITHTWAGDNYRITVHPLRDPTSLNDATGKLIAWRRVYTEVDKMYKIGSDLNLSFSPDDDSEPDTLYLDHVDWCAEHQSIVVFDTAHPDGEPAVIEAIDSVEGTITLDRDLSNIYTRGYDSTGKGAAVGLPSGGFWEVDLSRKNNAYGNPGDIYGSSHGSAFTEIFQVTNGSGPVPYEEYLDGGENPTLADFSMKWFSKYFAKNDYIHVIGANRSDTNNPIDWGLGTSGSNYGCIFSGQITNDVLDESNRQMAIQDGTIHEMGHAINLMDIVDDHHDVSGVCVNNNSGTDKCVMDYHSTRYDAISEFCYGIPNHLTGSQSIRGALGI